MKDMLGKSGFDVIGDVHGHAAELTILFKRMGYQETNGVLAASRRSPCGLSRRLHRPRARNPPHA